MKNKFVRYLSIVLIPGTVVLAIVVYQIWNKPHKDIKSADGAVTTAGKLYQDLSGNNSLAEFVNKVVIVSGEVKEVSSNQQGQQIILLKTEVASGSVNCTMEKKVDGLRAGDKIALKGLCLGYSGGDTDMNLPGDVFLTRCYQP